MLVGVRTEMWRPQGYSVSEPVDDNHGVLLLYPSNVWAAGLESPVTYGW